MLRFINLISGSGSTNLAILKAEEPGGRLYGLTKTVAVISSNPQAEGVKKVKEFGFPEKDIYFVFPKKGNLGKQLLEIFNKYKPHYFHQLGWLPLTPIEVLRKYKGLNQHLGPGGKGMYGIRRIYAFLWFCRKVGEVRKIPIFSQWVAPEYDKGDVIFLKYAKIDLNEKPEKIAQRLLPIEHEVQIEARSRLAKGNFKERALPKIAKNPKEEKILLEAIKKASLKPS